MRTTWPVRFRLFAGHLGNAPTSTISSSQFPVTDIDSSRRYRTCRMCRICHRSCTPIPRHCSGQVRVPRRCSGRAATSMVTGQSVGSTSLMAAGMAAGLPNVCRIPQFQQSARTPPMQNRRPGRPGGGCSLGHSSRRACSSQRSPRGCSGARIRIRSLDEPCSALPMRGGSAPRRGVGARWSVGGICRATARTMPTSGNSVLEILTRFA